MFPQSQLLKARKVLLALKREEEPKYWHMREDEGLWVHDVHLEPIAQPEELQELLTGWRIWVKLAGEPQVETPSYDQSLFVKAVYHQMRNSIDILVDITCFLKCAKYSNLK